MSHYVVGVEESDGTATVRAFDKATKRQTLSSYSKGGKALPRR